MVRIGDCPFSSVVAEACYRVLFALAWISQRNTYFYYRIIHWSSQFDILDDLLIKCVILSFKLIQSKILGLSSRPGNDWSPLRSATQWQVVREAGFQTGFFTSTMCFCFFVYVSTFFKMQLTYKPFICGIQSWLCCRISKTMLDGLQSMHHVYERDCGPIKLHTTTTWHQACADWLSVTT